MTAVFSAAIQWKHYKIVEELLNRGISPSWSHLVYEMASSSVLDFFRNPPSFVAPKLAHISQNYLSLHIKRLAYNEDDVETLEFARKVGKLMSPPLPSNSYAQPHNRILQHFIMNYPNGAYKIY